MQTQDASTEILIKFWPWLEANRKLLVGVAVALGVVGFGSYYYSTEKAQNAVDAGQAYTQLQLNMPPNPTVQQVADAFLQLAQKYSGTIAAERAQLQSAAVLFGAGRYADAQAVFQQFVGTHSGSSLAAAAQLGVAASLESQNKLDDALTNYRAVLTSYPDSADVLPAKFSLARVLEAQGKLKDASDYYQEVMRSPLAGSLASEAAQRLSQIQTVLAAAKPAAKS
jgi:predicted negative regulator of RcsB-dependent stress response